MKLRRHVIALRAAAAGQLARNIRVELADLNEFTRAGCGDTTISAFAWLRIAVLTATHEIVTPFTPTA